MENAENYGMPTRVGTNGTFVSAALSLCTPEGHDENAPLTAV